MIFKVKDTVYHFSYGEGKISHINNSTIKASFECGDRTFGILRANETLSFTPYDLINGGFSSIRPLPNLNDGDLVYVRGYAGLWELRYFHSFGPKGSIYTYANQNKCGTTVHWQEYSVENPLI